MGMGDPFSTTYEGAYKAANSLGQGLESAAGSVAGTQTDVAKMKYQQAQKQAQFKMLKDLGIMT